MCSEYESLELSLAELKRISDSKEFPDCGKTFQAQLKQSTSLNRVQRDYFWNEQQKLWDAWKHRSEKRRENSQNSKYAYMRDLRDIEFSHDGPCIMQSFTDWERVGEKVRFARQQIKEIQQRLKDDSTLIKADREDIRREINNIWFSINSTEDTTFFVHKERAYKLYNEASSAVDCLTPKDARAVLKATNAEVRTLYLKSSDRNMLRSWFDSLWSKLNSKYEEANTAWRSRQEAGISKLTESRNRLYESLKKVRDNISNNWSKYDDAKSSDFKDVVRGWISEGESREKEIECWIKDLDEKIDDCQSRLR